MVKKFNQIAATIKTLYQNHMKPITIARKIKDFKAEGQLLAKNSN